MAAYDIVPYTPALDAQIAALQTNLWSTEPARNAAYLRWKYIENPFLGAELMRIALCDGLAVAMRGLFGAQWEVDDASARHLLPYADDFVVAPEHRNRGLASHIMQATIDAGSDRGFPFAVSLSAGPVTYVGSLAAGWRSVGSYQSVWRRRTRESLIDRVARRARRVPGVERLATALQRGGARTLFARLDRAGRRAADRIRLGRTARAEEMAALIARLPWDGRIRHVRECEYFAWRFRNPLHEYRFLFWDEGGLQGYLVLQRYLSAIADQGCVNIADWEAVDERVRAGLLCAALQWGDFERVQTWTAGAAESVRAMLREQGFQPVAPANVSERSSGLLVRRLGKELADGRWALGGRDLLNIADWDLRMVYSMAG